jgi:DNA polymerase III subunit gamma/tau
MTDGSLFDLNALETRQVEDDPATQPPETPGAGGNGLTPAARDAAAPKSLYRKYRPQSFDSDELFGQDHIVNTLKNAIALDRIAHAYLFCGPRGTGKTTTARILAKAVNCLDPDPANRPCNACAACVSINNGSNTDVIEIDAASNRGIDDIRDLRERVKYAPSQLKTKFYIIDEAHQITGAAANAFLKTLEEPPAHTKFILATTDPEELLQTIVSRCQRFDFRRISLDAIVANLTRVAKAENIEIDEDAKVAIARHATGAMRDALGLLDQVAVYRENVDDDGTRVTLDLVRTVLGVSRNDRVESIVSALADKDAGAGLRAVGEAVEAGDDMRQLSRQLLAYLRMLLLERAGGETELDDAGKPLAQRFELRELAWLAQRFGDIDFKVKHATISQLPLEIAVVDGALRDQQPAPQAAPAQPSVQQPTIQQPAPPAYNAPPQEPNAPPQESPRPQPSRGGSLLARVRGEERQSSPTPRPQAAQPQSQPPAQRPAQAPPSAPLSTSQPSPAQQPPAAAAASAGLPANGVIQLEALAEGWANIRADVKAVSRRIEAILQQIDPVSINGNQVLLVSPYEFHKNRVNTDEVRQIIEDVIQRQFGAKVTVNCITRNELASMPQATSSAPATAAQPQAPVSPTPPPPAAEQPSSVQATPQDDPAPAETTDPPAEFDASRQIEAIKNIFDAEEERD